MNKLIFNHLPGDGSLRDCAIWVLHRLLPRSLFRILGLSRFRRAIEETAENKSKQGTIAGQICLAAKDLILGLERLAGYAPMVSPDRLYARGMPRVIRMTETYSFSQEVFGALGSGSCSKPVGQIQVVVPYDGLTHLNENARGDIARQLTYVEPCARAEALIGHLHFTNHRQTNLQELLASSSSEWSMGLVVPVRNNEITEPEQLSVDGHLSLLELSYKPSELEANPIQLLIELVDEEARSSDRHSVRIGETDRRIEPEKEVSRRISEQARSTHRLLIRMTVNLYLRFDAETPYPFTSAPQLRRLTLNWPAAATSRTLQARDDAFGQAAYDPIKRQFQWFDLDFELQSLESTERREGEGSQTKRFACSFEIEVTHPGMLYELGMMSGQMEIEIRGGLLSGIGARFYDAQGRLSNGSGLELSTRLTTDYSLQLDDAFLRQQRSPYLYLYFPDVLPDEDRFNVVVTALTDRGFQVKRRDVSSAHNRVKVEMTAKRPVVPQPVILELVIEGSGFDAIREKGVGGTETFTRNIRGGELEIWMHAKVSGNGKLQIKEMNELHRVLRERLPQMPA